MKRLSGFLPACVAILLLAIAGRGYAQNVDCRSCHGQGTATTDFSAIYTYTVAHHPVGIVYPSDSTASTNFNLPNGQIADVAFFDTNGNGLPDSDEIQLFGANGSATITCSSCHMEHGAVPILANAPTDAYLRVTLTGSALCSICHNQ
ncbi:MAG: hypothetical protein WAW75_10370 [Gallionella sp.]